MGDFSPGYDAPLKKKVKFVLYGRPKTAYYTLRTKSAQEEKLKINALIALAVKKENPGASNSEIGAQIVRARRIGIHVFDDSYSVRSEVSRIANQQPRPEQRDLPLA